MDLWGFKKWRRQLRYTQVVAGEKLGLTRGAIQYWESEHGPVPRAVELACQELLRLSKQQPDFGPVTLLYSDAPIGDDGSIMLQSERHPNNESALRSAAVLKRTNILLTALILEEDGNAVWSGPDLLRELHKNAILAIAKSPTFRRSPDALCEVAHEGSRVQITTGGKD